MPPKRPLPGVDAFVQANGLELCYQEFGAAQAPPIILTMGLGTQLTAWPLQFCQQLADAGLRVIRFDNRDVGLSSKCDESAGDHDSVRWAFVKSWLGKPVNAPYQLGDMAADLRALMDALKIERAHVVGASMGGMIAQILTALNPERVASLTSIMSSSGASKLPQGKPKVLWRLSKRPASKEPEVVVQHLVTTMRMIGSPTLQRSREAWAEQIRTGIARSYYPPGTTRQLLAVLANGSREALLRTIKTPTLVIHGDADPLVPLAHGEHTAECIAGARLQVMPGMGHDLPPPLIDALASMIAEHALSHA